MKNKKYQKIIIAIIVMNLVTLFSFIPSSSVAGFFEQSLQVPLQLELTPSQYWLDEQTRNNLIATYGISLFNSCSASERWCTSSMNASEYGTCLRFVQLDLAQGTMPGCQTPCLSGYFRVSNGECLTPEMGCNKEFGQDSHFIKYNSSGFPQCGSWDSKCKNDYGANSVWVGRLSNNGKAICDCAQGYVANPNGTNSCVVQTPSGTLCNGKYWNACPTDQKFYCPPTGDAQCIKNEELVVPVSTTDDIFPVTILQPNISEGALIRAVGDIDIYIVKYVGSKKFKRLILSPLVFNSYQHLKWSNVLNVSRSTVDSFTTSELVRSTGDTKVYQLTPQGDTGVKRWINLVSQIFLSKGYDPDAIYEINQTDRNAYVAGSDILNETNVNISVDPGQVIHRTFLIHAASPYQAVYELKIDIPENTYTHYRQDLYLGRKFDATKNVALWATIDEPILKHISDELRNLEKRDSRFPFLNSVFEVTKTIEYISDYSKNDSGEYWNYPIETLVEGKGDCEDMAFLTAGILGSIGWDVLLAGLPGHMAMAVEMPDVVVKSWSQTNYIPLEYYSYDGNKYYYIETTNLEQFKFSQIPQEYKNIVPDFYSVLKAFPIEKKPVWTTAAHIEWKPYTYSNDKFQVSFPGDPAVSMESYRTEQYNTYKTCSNEGVCYAVLAGDTKQSTFVPTIKQQQEMALLTRTGTDINTQKLISGESILVGGYTAYDALILNSQVGTRKGFIKKRIIYATPMGKYYEMIIGYFDDGCQKANCGQFFDSFKIIK